MDQRLPQLDTLVKLRHAERDRRRAAWASASRAELAVQAERDQVAAALTAAQAAARRGAAPGATDVRQLGDQQRYGQILRERLADLTRRHEVLREQLADLQQALLVAEREVRILENLREKRSAQAQAARSKSEAGQLREITLQKVGVAPTDDFSDK